MLRNEHFNSIPPLGLPEIGQMAHVRFDAGAMVLAGAIEALILRAIKAEPLLLGAFGAVARSALLGKEHLAAVLADALPCIDRAVRAIVLPIAIPARYYPIPA
jgi:hypothetical protein